MYVEWMIKWMMRINQLKILNVNELFLADNVHHVITHLLGSGAVAGGTRMNKLWPPLLYLHLFNKKSSMSYSQGIQLMKVSRPAPSLLGRTFSKEGHQTVALSYRTWLPPVMIIYSALWKTSKSPNILTGTGNSYLALFYSSYSHLFLFSIPKVSFYSIYLLRIKGLEHSSVGLGWGRE